MGWFQVAKAPPMVDEAIFSNTLNLSLSDLPRAFLIDDSARRVKPMLEPELNIKHHLWRYYNIPGAPVSTLAHCDGIHALVDTPNTLSTIDISEHSPSRWRLDTRSGLLVARDLSRLHTRTET